MAVDGENLRCVRLIDPSATGLDENMGSGSAGASWDMVDYAGAGTSDFGGYSAGDHFSSDSMGSGSALGGGLCGPQGLTSGQMGALNDVLGAPTADLPDGQTSSSTYGVYVDANGDLNAVGNPVVDANGNPVESDGIPVSSLPGQTVTPDGTVAGLDNSDVPSASSGPFVADAAPPSSLLAKIGAVARGAWDEFNDHILPALPPVDNVVIGGVKWIGGLHLASGLATVRIGQKAEQAVREVYEIGPSVQIIMNGVKRRPDGFIAIGEKVISEVKNVRSLSFTRQLRDYAAHANVHGIPLDLYIRADSRLTGPLVAAQEAGLIRIKLIPPHGH